MYATVQTTDTREILQITMQWQKALLNPGKKAEDAIIDPIYMNLTPFNAQTDILHPTHFRL